MRPDLFKDFFIGFPLGDDFPQALSRQDPDDAPDPPKVIVIASGDGAGAKPAVCLSTSIDIIHRLAVIIPVSSGYKKLDPVVARVFLHTFGQHLQTMLNRF